jgi:hypothetical protein
VVVTEVVNTFTSFMGSTVQFYIHKSQPWDLSQLNPAHTLTPYFCKICLELGPLIYVYVSQAASFLTDINKHMIS